MGVGWIPIYHWYHHTSMRGVLYTVHFFELWHVQHIWMCLVCYKSPSRDFQRRTSPGFHFSNGQRFQFPGWGLGTRTRTVSWKWQSVDDSKFITWQRRRPGLTTKNAHSAGGSGESLNERRHRHRCLKFLPLGGTFLLTCHIKTLWMFVHVMHHQTWVEQTWTSHTLW